MMETGAGKTIYTIGHSTRGLGEFIGLLESFSIKILADVRNFPGSRRYPHFNGDALAISLKGHNIRYIHFKALGGRRKPLADSHNDAWRNEAFRGFADYMETSVFKEAITELEKIAVAEPTAIMCSEAVWWRCHRALISDYLKTRGWKVLHIMAINKSEEHPYTSLAKIKNGKLTYRKDYSAEPDLFDDYI